MGDNEIRLVEAYFKLSKELEKARHDNDNHNYEVIKAKMEGIIFGYETYASSHWSTFENLIEKYNHYNR